MPHSLSLDHILANFSPFCLSTFFFFMPISHLHLSLPNELSALLFCNWKTVKTMLVTFGSIHSRPTYGNHVAVRNFKCATVTRTNVQFRVQRQGVSRYGRCVALSVNITVMGQLPSGNSSLLSTLVERGRRLSTSAPVQWDANVHGCLGRPTEGVWTCVQSVALSFKLWARFKVAKLWIMAMCNTTGICRFRQSVAVWQRWPTSQLLLYTNFTSVLCVLHDPPLYSSITLLLPGGCTVMLNRIGTKVPAVPVTFPDLQMNSASALETTRSWPYGSSLFRFYRSNFHVIRRHKDLAVESASLKVCCDSRVPPSINPLQSRVVTAVLAQCFLNPLARGPLLASKNNHGSLHPRSRPCSVSEWEVSKSKVYRIWKLFHVATYRQHVTMHCLNVP